MGAKQQSITALTPNVAATLTFYWAGAQQQEFNGATTEKWQVSLGTETYTTPVVNILIMVHRVDAAIVHFHPDRE